MADAAVSKTVVERRAGSNPASGTTSHDKGLLSASLFCFPHFFDSPIRDAGKCTSGQFGRQSCFGTPKTIMRLDLQLFAIRDCRGTPNNRFRPENAANRPRNGPFPLCTDRRESLIAKKLQKHSKFCFRDGRTNLMGGSAQRVSPPHSSHSYRTIRSQQGHTNAGAKGKVLLLFANSQTKARTIPINATNRT